MKVHDLRPVGALQRGAHPIEDRLRRLAIEQHLPGLAQEAERPLRDQDRSDHTHQWVG